MKSEKTGFMTSHLSRDFPIQVVLKVNDSRMTEQWPGAFCPSYTDVNLSQTTWEK